MGLFALFTGRLPRRPSARRTHPAPLAPRRLERRRVLDAAAAELLLGPSANSSEYVQAGENLTSPEPAAVVEPNLAPENVQLFLSANEIFENDLLLLGVTFDDSTVDDTHQVVIDWGDGTTPELFSIDPGARFLSTSHQYLDDNPTSTAVDVNQIKVSITDGAGNEASAISAVTVKNLSPTIEGLSITPVVNEDGVVLLQVVFSDPGARDTHTVEIDWGDGTSVEDVVLDPGARFLATSHQYLDDNPTATPSDVNIVKVKVIDDDGGTAMTERQVLVNNLAPKIDSLSVTPALEENGFAQLQLEISDPGTQDSHTVEIDWGDGTPFEHIVLGPGTLFLATSHQYLDDNPTSTPSDAYTVKVNVVDDDLGAAMAERQVIVNNLAPTIDAVSVTPMLDENGVAQLELTFSDMGTQDSHSVEIDWGDGTPFENIVLGPGTLFLATSHQYLDDNPTATLSDIYTVRVKVVDDDSGGPAVAERQVLVKNVRPTIDSLAITTPINEHQFAMLTGTFSDPGSQDTFELDIDWDGDSVFDQTVTVSGGAFAVSRQFLDDDPTGTMSDTFDVNVRLRDDDLGEDTGQVSLTVNNLPPSDLFVLPFVGGINENEEATIILTFDDVGTLDTHLVDIDWGDGSPVERVEGVAPRSFLVFNHQYLDDDPTATIQDVYQVELTVIDDDGGQAMIGTEVTVRNVPPVLTVAADQTIDEGTLLDLSGGGLASFIDAGTLDTHTATVNWGDGSATEVATVNQGSGLGTLDGSHLYADNGLYTVTVVLTDDDSGTNVETFLVDVLNVDPELTVVGDQVIDEGALLQISDLGTFTDPGFDNPLNTLDPGNGGETEERFFYEIDWGDGSATGVLPAPIDQPGSPGVASSGSFDGSHIYADNGLYTVTVELTDDDGGIDIETFQVLVSNVNPTLVDTEPVPTVKEGEAFTLAGLGVSLTDPGFDNPLNPLVVGGSQETFTALTVDWGDGTPADALSVVGRVSGSEGVDTTAGFAHAPHTYADNGLYTVTITVGDDDGGFVMRTFKIQVDNVAPTLVLTDRPLEIDEGDTLNLFDLGAFSDPGFDNPLNVGDPANGGEVVETFSYTIDWGDGTVETGQLPATVVSGSVGVDTLGTLVDSHQYLDNDADNLYTIRVTLSDDDGGVDTQEIIVRVLNVDPSLEPILATDLNTSGETFLTMEFADPGTETLTVWVDWGDQLALPPDARFVPETFVVGPGTQNLTLLHVYSGPPNPMNPAADIVISVFIRDDDFGMPLVVDPGQSVTQVVAITNPGEGVNPIRIDTTPQVPRLIFPQQEESTFFVGASSSDESGAQSTDLRAAVGDTKSTTDRFLELRVIDPATGDESEGYRLKPEVLNDLPGLFRTLPDNRYAIYLIRTETNTRRLVIEVYVRNGKLIDPGDDSEGTRDRPPTDEATDEPIAEPQPDETSAAEPVDSAASPLPPAFRRTILSGLDLIVTVSPRLWARSGSQSPGVPRWLHWPPRDRGERGLSESTEPSRRPMPKSGEVCGVAARTNGKTGNRVLFGRSPNYNQGWRVAVQLFSVWIIDAKLSCLSH